MHSLALTIDASYGRMYFFSALKLPAPRRNMRTDADEDPQGAIMVAPLYRSG